MVSVKWVRAGTNGGIIVFAVTIVDCKKLWDRCQINLKLRAGRAGYVHIQPRMNRVFIFRDVESASEMPPGPSSVPDR